MLKRASFVLAGLALVACDGGSGAPTKASAAPADATASNAPAVAAPQPPPPPPDDIDLGPLKKALKCANDASSGACGVLTKFGTCKPWNAIPPSGDGRWIGRGVDVDKGKSTETFVIVRSHRVGTAEVAPGQIGAKIAIAEITEKENKAAFDAADRMIRILERADVAPRFNAALDYVNKKTDWDEAFATLTKSGQVNLLTSGGAFACAGPRRQVLIVSRSPTSRAQGDGLYAEVWATSW